jgi:hypothetical protein
MYSQEGGADMQKDVHFYLTYLLAIKAGIPNEEAETIAWADQYTDDLTEAELYGIQTQSAILGNWEDRQIQLSVLAAFHFLPGSDPKYPWVTTRNNARARKLVAKASKDPIPLGIALHGLQDTFSHEGFSGWREDVNSCFPWYYITSALPNIGHAEMRVVPDVVNYVWTDPRNGKRIDNKKRTMSAAIVTWQSLTRKFNPTIDHAVWQNLQPQLQEAFKIECYDDRKKRFCELSGTAIDYNQVSATLKPKYGNDFVVAARSHLANAMLLFRELPMNA